MFTHRARGPLSGTLTLAFCAGAVFAVAACGRLPTDPMGRFSGTRALSARAVSPTYGADRVIARLTPGVTPGEVAASYGTTVLDYIPELRLALLHTPTDLSEGGFITRLSADPRVEFSELDYALQTAEGRQSVIAFSEGNRTWPDVVDQDAFVRVGAAAAQALVPTGSPLVAILDTGIELDHPALQASLRLPGIEPGVTVDPGDDRAEHVDSNGDGIVDGALGHGTHVAGIVHALAPAAGLLPVRVLDSDGFGYAFAIVRGLVAAVARGATVINMSMGMSGSSAAVKAAVDYAGSLGIVIVAPAGNSASAEIEFPAAYGPVIAVAGTDSLDHKASFSNYGSGVDIAAPATGILSTYVGGGFAVWSGTSMATPFATGVAALLYGALGPANPATAQRIEQLLSTGAEPLGAIDPVFGNALGAGRLSAIGSAQALEAQSGDVAVSSPRPTFPAPHR